MAVGQALGQQGDPPLCLAEYAAARQLIEDLGSPRFRTREAAAEGLRKLGVAALPALRRAADSASPEVRRRCQQLIDHITTRADEEHDRQVVQRVTARWGKGGAADFLARLGRDPKFATPEHIRQAWQLAEYAAVKASQISGRRYRLPALDVTRLPLARGAQPWVYGKVCLCPSHAHLGITQLGSSFLVSSALVPGISCNNSVVVMTGDLGGGTGIANSVIVCIGDVRSVTGIENSVVLATGRLEGFTSGRDSFFEVEGLGRCTTSTNNVYLNLKKVQATVSGADRFLPGPGPLQLFTAGMKPADTRAVREEQYKLVTKVSRRWFRGGLREFLARLAREPAFASPERRQEVVELAQAIAAQASLMSGRRFRAPPLDLTNGPLSRQENLLLLLPGQRAPAICRDKVVIALGDLRGAGLVQHSLVLCLGDAERMGSVKHSVVVVSGRLAGFTGAEDSFFELGDLGECTSSENNIYLGRKRVNATRSVDDRFLPGPGPLALFRTGPPPRPATRKE